MLVLNLDLINNPQLQYFPPLILARIHRNLTGMDRKSPYLGSILCFYFRHMFWEVFIVLHWFLPESGQFPEFRGNQFWQRALPNWSNDSGRISNGIQIPPEWFQESPGRNTAWNEMEWNTVKTLLTHTFWWTVQTGFSEVMGWRGWEKISAQESWQKFRKNPNLFLL